MRELGTAARLSGFVALLGAVFAAALGVGAWAGPEQPAAPAAEPHSDTHSDTHSGEGTVAAAPQTPGGLMTTQDGYALDLTTPTARSGRDVPVTFRVTGPDGHAVTGYDVSHEKELHLVAVRRDQTGFQHVHPRRDEDGTWHTELDLTPGAWRLFADFDPSGGDPLTLGTDLAVAGDYQPAVARPETRVAQVDGYTVTLAGDLEPGAASDLTLSVARDGEPVTDLQPYLGALGHLVALRGGDLAYLHVHPHETAGTGPEVAFTAEVPSTGRYHLYLDFKHGDTVRTAAFVLEAGGEEDSHGH